MARLKVKKKDQGGNTDQQVRKKTTILKGKRNTSKQAYNGENVERDKPKLNKQLKQFKPN